MLQKKLSSLEDTIKDKSRVEVERDESSMKFRKVQKQCEKFRAELLQSQQLVTNLKAQLLETSELKVLTLLSTISYETVIIMN